MARAVTIMTTDMVSTLRLFQLISPSLPTGAFTYSQGLEWAVERGWVSDRHSLEQWLKSCLHTGFGELEIPVLRRLYLAGRDDDLLRFRHWADYIVACRETSELRREEINRGRAMARLLVDLGLIDDHGWLSAVRACQAAGFALASVKWHIALPDCALGYIWSWLENMVMAAVKIVPLGQTVGQHVLCALALECSRAVTAGLEKEDDEIKGSCPAFALSSSLHETQYTRLFRS